jgi:hypothetical protein
VWGFHLYIYLWVSHYTNTVIYVLFPLDLTLSSIINKKCWFPSSFKCFYYSPVLFTVTQWLNIISSPRISLMTSVKCIICVWYRLRTFTSFVVGLSHSSVILDEYVHSSRCVWCSPCDLVFSEKYRTHDFLDTYHRHTFQVMFVEDTSHSHGDHIPGREPVSLWPSRHYWEGSLQHCL